MRCISLSLLLAVALMICWWGAFYYSDHTPDIQRVHGGGFSSVDPEISQPIKLGSVRQAAGLLERAVKIKCEFKLHKPEAMLAYTPQYSNLFQTADGDTGIRLEFAILADGALTWGLVIGSQSGKNPRSMPLGTFAANDEWHSIEIEAKAERVLVRLDGYKIGDEVWPDLEYAMDNVIVGSAMGMTRPFSGDIRQFVMRTFQFSPSLVALSQTLSNLIPVCLALGLLGQFFHQMWVPRDKWLQPHLTNVWSSPEGTWGKLRLLLMVIAFGHLLAGIYYYWNAVYLNNPYPYNSYLSYPRDRFTDFDNMVIMCSNLNPYHDHSRSGYPPLANFFFYLFSPFSMRFGFILFMIPPVYFLVWAARLLLKPLSCQQRLLAIVFVLIFSYPFVFAFDRGNSEFYIMIALGTFFLYYNAKTGWRRDLACLGLAIGISLKIYPVLLLLLPLKDRRYYDCLKVMLMSEVLTVGAALTFVGGAQAALLDFRGILSETDQLVKQQLQYAHGNSGIYYGMVIVFTKLRLNTLLQWCHAYYWLVALGLLGGYALLIARARLSFWASSVCVVALMCLIPSLSNDYRTIQLLIPLLLFATTRTPVSKGYTFIAVLLGLLLVPRNYWILFPDVPPGDVGIGSIITPVVLFVLLNTILYLERFGWPEPAGPGRAGSAVSRFAA